MIFVFQSFPAFKVAIFIYEVTHEVYIFIGKVSKINIRIIYDYKFIKPQILRQNARWSFWIGSEIFFLVTEDVYVKGWKIINTGDIE